MHKRSVPFEAALYPQLQTDDEFVVEYLNALLAESEPALLLLGIRQLAEARGVSMTSLAKASGLQRQSLYGALSETGNPELETLSAVLNALGFQIAIQAKSVS